MKLEERVETIIKTLNSLYPKPDVPLNHQNTFTLLIAVVMSAQSTDKKVNELTKELFLKANNSTDMEKIGEESIYSYIREIGLSKQKSKYIYSLSKILNDKYKGIVPKSFEELESLPGVGHKTASVVMAQAYGIPTFPVDTHIHRLAQRWELTSGRSVKETEKDLKRIFPKSQWNKLHLQIIFYGREFCSARNCDGTVCLLCKELFPKRKKPIKHIKA